MRKIGLWTGALALWTSSVASAAVIGNDDFYAITTNEQGSGNGTLDLRLFSAETAANKHSPSNFDADDGNTSLPSGNNAPPTASGSYITSMGELRDFYVLNFPDLNNPGTSIVDEIAIFVDVNELGSVNDIKLNDLRVVIDFNQIGNVNDDRNDPAANDIGSADQNATGSGFSGGTTVAQLDGLLAPKSLPLNNQGGGWADFAIFTGINPFDNAFTDSTRVLFYWDSADHDNGGESIFLSGEVSPQDVQDSVPEPTTSAAAALLAAGAVMLRRRRRS